MELTAFVIAALFVILIPGPNVLVIVSTSLVHGRWRGLQTVAGTSTAMILQLLIAGVATQSLLQLAGVALEWLKWCGVAYLCYLGIRHLTDATPPDTTNALSAAGSFGRGFWVSLTNPKTILFFSAFLPQFVSDVTAYSYAIAMLSIIFWLLAVVLDSGYALFASAIQQRLRRPGFTQGARRVAGGFYIGASALLALSHQRQ